MNAPTNFDFSQIASIKPKMVIQKPIMMIHGDEKTGKTTFACQAPNPIVLDLENGLTGQTVARWPENSHDIPNIEISHIGGFLSYLRDNKTPFDTLVIDSFSKLEEKIWQGLMKEHKKESMEAFGYGKGYKMAAEKFQIVMNLLASIRDKQNMNIVIICHSHNMNIAAADGNDYTVKSPHLHKDAVEIVKRYSDLIGHAKIQVIQTSETKDGFGSSKTITKLKGDKSSARRIIDWGKNPAYVSGSRGVDLSETNLDFNDFQKAYDESIKTRQSDKTKI